MDHIIVQMKSLGLTEYEVKAYLTLLREHPINGYSLSKHSGIPRSRIYEVLEGLCKKQIVFEQSDGKGSFYSPLEPGLLIKKLRSNFEETIASVDDYTTKLYSAKDEDLEPRILRGHGEIMEMIRVLLRDAQARVAVSIWDEELRDIKNELTGLLERNIKVRGVYFGYSNPFEDLVPHRRMERYVAEKEERYIIVIVDNKHMISGIISRGEASQATWSKDPGIIEISDDFIAHDVMLNTYTNRLEGEDKARYERTLDEVRKDYYGFSDEAFELFPMP